MTYRSHRAVASRFGVATTLGTMALGALTAAHSVLGPKPLDVILGGLNKVVYTPPQTRPRYFYVAWRRV